MGTGLVESVNEVQEDWGERLSINLKMKCSDAFKDGELTPE